ncbi:MAG TPA: ferric reductase-like transmembrane domain-containing protein [Streptosporangiaceae bacterium]|jgi:predicted ferric reductase
MTLWFATRALGLVTLTLFSTVMVLGLLTAGRRAPWRQPAFVITGLHRSLALLSVVFLGLHIATSVLDDFVTIRWVDAVVPFGAAYRPFWLGLGATALDLILALVITSLLRTRLGLRTWRAVHWLAYACWPIAVVHGAGIGTDTRLTLAFDAICCVAVAAAAAVRLSAVARAGTYRQPITGGTR